MRKCGPVVLAALIVAVLTGCLESEKDRGPREVVRSVRLNHPGLDPQEKMPLKLVQVIHSDSPDEFYMDVDSVFCGDGVCRLDRVRLWWNDLGRYLRYELEPGVSLEKNRGMPFSENDYDHLQRILLDSDSVLRNVRLTDIRHEESSDEVDAVSSATPPLYQGASVQGAVWTCFTLWHWANGDVEPVIRMMRAEAASLNDLHDLLENGDEPHQLFALEQLIARRAFDPSSRAAVTACAPSFGRTLTKRSFRYFELASTPVYYASMESLLRTVTDEQRILYLNSMLKIDREPPAPVLDQLGRLLSGTSSYQEVDLLLSFLERWRTSSVDSSAQVLPLLDHPDFLIARRAFWFLQDQALTNVQRQVLEAFRRTHSARL